MTIFQSSSLNAGHPGYLERSGETVEVVCSLPEPDCVDAAMYRIRFLDGVETDAFEWELVE